MKANSRKLHNTELTGLHCLMLGGGHRLTNGVPIFQPVPAPTPDQMQTILTRISAQGFSLHADTWCGHDLGAWFWVIA